ncbi:MAG: hypothetical protein ABJA66_02835 [Actinomycetota bacterium]
MATWYTMAIENKDSSIKGRPGFVWVQLNHIWIPINDDLWGISLSQKNNWIGRPGGILMFRRKTLYFTGSDKTKYVMQWDNIDFPNDCSGKDGEAWKTGIGEYFSTYTGKWYALEWSNRNIISES